MIVDFIIPTYDRIDHLRCMLSCLMAQSCNEWMATVVVDSKENNAIEELVKSFCDNRIRCYRMDKRYDDWGHSPREFGKQKSDCKYVVMTGDDNYYTPIFVHEIKKAVEDHGSPEIIYFDMVHSHYDYQLFKCSLAMNQIDMGAFATRSDIAKMIKLSSTYAADGVFIEDFKRLYPHAKTAKIEKVLFVHN